MSPVGAQGPGGVDLAAVARDDQLLDLLATRAATPADDLVAVLLAKFAEDVDVGLPELLAEAAERESAGPAEETGVRRSRGLRVTSLALVVGATLSVSGVAAAVTGDPLAPYKGLVSAVTGEDQLPEQAARVAALNHALRGTRAQIAHGDLAGAQARLDALKAQLSSMTGLSHGERAALKARIAALEAALARAQAGPGKPSDPGKSATAPGKAVDRSGTTDAGKPDQPSDHPDNGKAGTGAQSGDRGSGQGSDKAKPTSKPSAPTGKQADEQGSGGSTADESVAPEAEPSTGSADEGSSTADLDGSTSDGSSGQPGSPQGEAQGQDTD